MHLDQAPCVSRYRIEGRLGAGGLGVVFEAHDPQLHRDVAVKLLRLSEEDDRAFERLRREAAALARVSHPNVVPVFDVGRYEAHYGMRWPPDVPRMGVYLVMELVRGQTLRAWLQTPRDPDAVLHAFIAAGRGLAAAHSVSLTHRDFKPANVVIASDGAVKVLDFGIAKLQQPDYGHTSSPDAPVVETMDCTGPMTTHGTVIGTPAYMAPEQHEAGVVDARADQYAFCIALTEALCGTRPFAGRTLEDLYRTKTELDLDPHTATIAPRLWAILRRGLSCDPEDRWPSMDALLQALEHGARRRAWTPVVLAGLALGLGAAVWASRPGVPLEALPIPESAPVDAVLDTMGQPPSDAATRLRTAAESAWAEFDVATVAALVQAHAPSDDASEDPSLTAELLIWEARAGTDAAGAELTQRAFFLAKEADVPSIAARAASATATAVVDDHGQAIAEWVRHAWVEAEREPWDRSAAIDVAVTAAWGRAIAVPDEHAADLLHFAAAIVGRVELDDSTYVASELVQLAAGWRYLGEPDQAIYWAREAMALLDAIAEPDHPLYGLAQQELGTAMTLLHRCDEALPHLDRALASHLAHGDQQLASEAVLVHKHIAECLTVIGRFPEAIAEYHRMLDQNRAIGMEESIQTIDAHVRIARLLARMQRTDEARVEYETALSMVDSDAPDRGLRAAARTELQALGGPARH